MKQAYSYAILLLIIIVAHSCRSEKTDLSDPDNISLTNLPHNPTNYTATTPEFFAAMPIPADNPLTVEGIELGRYLFYDPILSANQDISCATCHQLAHNFSNTLAVATGSDGQLNSRSTLPLANIGYVQSGFFWDGRAGSLESATAEELTNSMTLNGHPDKFLKRLRSDEQYRRRFRAAFPVENTKEIDVDLVAKALAQFQRTFVTANSRLDRAQGSNGFSLTDLELDGYFLFFREQNFTPHPGCSHCHLPTYYDSDAYYNNGLDSVGNLNEFADAGRGGISGIYTDNGKFRVPTLRNIEKTAPYMHDGRLATLEAVLDHYSSGGHPAENLDEQITGFPLTDYEKASLLAFLKSLTDEDFLDNAALKSPF